MESVTGNSNPFYDLACRYAQAVDRRNKELLLPLFAVDAKILAPGGIEVNGHEDLAGMPEMMAKMFECTQHKIFNQTISIQNDTATGETYCTASHIKVVDGKREVEDWAIRYQDQYVKIDGQWLFQRRELIVDWVEVRPAMIYGEQF